MERFFRFLQSIWDPVIIRAARVTRRAAVTARQRERRRQVTLRASLRADDRRARLGLPPRPPPPEMAEVDDLLPGPAQAGMARETPPPEIPTRQGDVDEGRAAAPVDAPERDDLPPPPEGPEPVVEPVAELPEAAEPAPDDPERPQEVQEPEGPLPVLPGEGAFREPLAAPDPPRDPVRRDPIPGTSFLPARPGEAAQAFDVAGGPDEPDPEITPPPMVPLGGIPDEPPIPEEPELAQRRLEPPGDNDLDGRPDRDVDQGGPGLEDRFEKVTFQLDRIEDRLETAKDEREALQTAIDELPDKIPGGFE